MVVLEDESGKRKYTTAARVQAWFLGRSRDRWKRKHQELKRQAKRLQNRVNDVARSREKWRGEAEQLRRRVQELEAAALRQQDAAEKKDGAAAAGPGGG